MGDKKATGTYTAAKLAEVTGASIGTCRRHMRLFKIELKKGNGNAVGVSATEAKPIIESIKRGLATNQKKGAPKKAAPAKPAAAKPAKKPAQGSGATRYEGGKKKAEK